MGDREGSGCTRYLLPAPQDGFGIGYFVQVHQCQCRADACGDLSNASFPSFPFLPSTSHPSYPPSPPSSEQPDFLAFNVAAWARSGADPRTEPADLVAALQVC